MEYNTFDNLLINESKMFNEKNIQNVFLISDTHFNHEKIGIYCDRPKDWQNIIIRNWNNIVNKNDVVLHLGDFGFGSKERVLEIRNELNGEIYMIKGNHDRHSVGWYGDIGITMYKKPFTVYIKDEPYLFSHAVKPCKYNIIGINGHWHNKSSFVTIINNNPHVNISVEQINYTPIKFKDLIKKINIHGHFI